MNIIFFPIMSTANIARLEPCDVTDSKFKVIMFEMVSLKCILQLLQKYQPLLTLPIYPLSVSFAACNICSILFMSYNYIKLRIAKEMNHSSKESYRMS
jgi:hypothetical protein